MLLLNYFSKSGVRKQQILHASACFQLGKYS